MWTDDYHDHFVRPENKKDLDEIIAPLVLYIVKQVKFL
jgi:hypothetical protein